LIGINKNTLHDYEIGKRYPPGEFVFDFCETLGLSAEKLMRDWIGFHPNPNVSKHVNEGCYAVRDIWKDSNSYMDPSDADVIQFIQRAIQVANHTHHVNLHRGQVAHNVACTAAKIIHRIIVRGLPIHPNSINTKENLYIMYDSPFEIDENECILGKKENPEK